MSEFYEDYHAAFATAQTKADATGREMGLSATKEYGKPGFAVFHIPQQASQRFGRHHTCEVVSPMRTNSLLPDPADEAEIERLESLLANLRAEVGAVLSELESGYYSRAFSASRLRTALAASDPSRKES